MEMYLEGTSRIGLLLSCSGILAKGRPGPRHQAWGMEEPDQTSKVGDSHSAVSVGFLLKLSM